ncbi:hypothetical protein [Catellatospora citrea]|uniref:PknH-like protein n=1 Tax=Catellatospora citrea TaxID=53366 RepID=A0A8J3P385_9ACTN|nr:hypothetical protein [Catellatospora citrea]RKE08823.1 hypothetical protein C8E86_3690 [Catellatospora citrea]GIG02448.1 hypothetical protein Cci01nite_75410 [Catellatospora citrea]
MRDDISQQLDGFGADMPAMVWASPETIRGRGERRRRVRTAGLTAAAVVATVLVAGTAFALGTRPGDPAPPATTATPAVPSISMSPSARPSRTSPSAGPSATAGAPFDTVIPAGAMLRASDVSPAHRVDEGEYLGETYQYVTGLCQDKGQWDGKPPAPDGSRVRESFRQRVLAAGQGRMHVLQRTSGYGSAQLAGARVAHERAGFEHCAVVDHRETHVEFEILRSGFAGDESLLVRLSPDVLLVLVRVGAVYTDLSLTFPDTPGAADEALAAELGRKAVTRICDATTAC